ncbi:hypothetical protein SNE40_001175 [Patella caerulea]|uniref:TIR domain-containing protein n=1 Tax=Patella caerulea TaxID=87958 RepID=A0AAN8Q7V3_PATCE
MKTIYTSIIILLYFYLINGEIVCPQTSDHQYGGITVNCSHTNISSVPDIPDKLLVNTTTLDLTFNYITILYNNDFLHLVNLRYLDVSFNPIQALESSSFNGLSSLLILEFNGHELNYSEASMPVHVFKPLQSLTNLSMRSDISRFGEQSLNLPNKFLECLTNLKQLNIDTGKNTMFHNGFSNLIRLQHLILGKTQKHGIVFECGLSTVFNKTFSGLRNTPTIYLDLTSCHLENLHKDSLQPLPDLQTVLLDGMHLDNGNIADAIEMFRIYKNKNMSHISINFFRSGVNFMDTGVTIDMTIFLQICLKSLDIRNSRIGLLSFDIEALNFDNFICLEDIQLSHNHLHLGGRITVWLLLLPFFQKLNIKTLDISNQRELSLEDITVRHNEITQHLPIGLPFMLPNKIESVNAAGVSPVVGPLSDIYFVGGKNLKFLNLSYCGFFDFNHTLVGIENTETLDFSFNDMSVVSKRFFDTFPNLITLRLGNTLLDNDFIIENGKRLFSPLVKIQNLDLSGNGLVFLPYDIFSSLVTLQVINLAFNNLITIPDLTSLYKLNFIDLSHNSFTTIDNKYRLMLDKTAENNNNLFNLSLRGNTFSCICESTEFLIWLQETGVKLDGGNYTCVDANGQMSYTKTIQTQWAAFRRHCVSGFWLNMAVGGTSVVVVTLITAFVFIKNKMKLKLILLRMIGQNIFPKKRNEFLYDAYIIYTDSICSWVCNELRTELETNRNIKLNLRDRDHLPGGSHADDILEAIRDSWKIVLILTEDFLKGDLAYFTMCNCLSAITLTTPQRLIIVIDHRMRIPTNIDFLLESVSQRNIVKMIPEPPNIGIRFDILTEAILSEDVIL